MSAIEITDDDRVQCEGCGTTFDPVTYKHQGEVKTRHPYKAVIVHWRDHCPNVPDAVGGMPEHRR